MQTYVRTFSVGTKQGQISHDLLLHWHIYTFIHQYIVIWISSMHSGVFHFFSSMTYEKKTHLNVYTHTPVHIHIFFRNYVSRYFKREKERARKKNPRNSSHFCFDYTFNINIFFFLAATLHLNKCPWSRSLCTLFYVWFISIKIWRWNVPIRTCPYRYIFFFFYCDIRLTEIFSFSTTNWGKILVEEILSCHDTIM